MEYDSSKDSDYIITESSSDYVESSSGVSSSSSHNINDETTSDESFIPNSIDIDDSYDDSDAFNDNNNNKMKSGLKPNKCSKDKKSSKTKREIKYNKKQTAKGGPKSLRNKNKTKIVKKLYIYCIIGLFWKFCNLIFFCFYVTILCNPMMYCVILLCGLLLLYRQRKMEMIKEN